MEECDAKGAGDLMRGRVNLKDPKTGATCVLGMQDEGTGLVF